MKIGSALETLWHLVGTVRNWPIYFANRAGWINGSVTYKLRNGLTLTCRNFSKDRGALNDVWLDESYDPNIFGTPFDWSSCHTIVDIGANVGAFTLFAAWKAPQSRIIAVEAEPSNANVVRNNILQNDLEHRVTTIAKAVGGSIGTLRLFIAKNDSGGNSMFEYQKGAKSIDVPMITLQSLFEEHGIDTCDYLKIDCEGAEYDILYASPESITNRIRFIGIEYHHFSNRNTHTPEALRAFLESRGFTVTVPKKSFFFAIRKA